MIVILNIITHIMIILGITGLIFYIGYAVHKEQEMFEKIILMISSMTGFLIYFGARALGLSIPSMIMTSVSMTNPIKMILFSIVIPWTVGTIVAWYFSWCLKKHIDIAFRVVVLISAFIVTLFSDVYAASYAVEINGKIDISLLPNLTFTVGMGLYIILNYKHR